MIFGKNFKNKGKFCRKTQNLGEILEIKPNTSEILEKNLKVMQKFGEKRKIQ